MLCAGQFQDGGVEVTGFNLEDEKEEGYFDKDGNFIFKKSDDHAGDVWLEGAGVYNPEVSSENEGAPFSWRDPFTLPPRAQLAHRPTFLALFLA